MTSRSDAARKAAAARTRKLELDRSEQKRRSRRRFLLGAAATAGVGIVGLSGYQVFRSMNQSGPPYPLVPGSYELRYYIGVQQKGSWYSKLEGKPVRPADFSLNQGAYATWEGVPVIKPISILYLDPNSPHTIPGPGGGTRQATGFSSPAEARVVPHGRGIFVAYYSGCTHACCTLGYHEVYTSLDIYHCTCHNARFDPWMMTSAKDENGTRYLGAQQIQQPATRPLPYVPLELIGDRLHGILTEENREWYRYCGVKKESR